MTIRIALAGALAALALTSPAQAADPALAAHPPTGAYDDATPQVDFDCLADAEGPPEKRNPDLAVICASHRLRTLSQLALDRAGAAAAPAAPGVLSWQCGVDQACFAQALAAKADPGDLSVASECAAPYAAALGPGFAIVCGSPELRQLWDEASGLELQLSQRMSGGAWKALPDVTPQKLVEGCGTTPAPATGTCYAELIRRNNALLRRHLNAKEN
jgi:hypothetical protein